MHGAEIKQKIDFNNKEIERLLQPNAYVLNNFISELLTENARLQSQCSHEFENGFCIYCYQQEKEE